ELGERATLVVVARHRPGMERAVAQRSLGMRDDERFVVLQNGAKAVALGARTARTVEREKLGRRSRRTRAVVRALEALGEPQRTALGENDGVAIAFAECRRDGVGQTTSRLVVDAQPVDDDEQLARPGQIVGAALEVLEV